MNYYKSIFDKEDELPNISEPKKNVWKTIGRIFDIILILVGVIIVVLVITGIDFKSNSVEEKPNKLSYIEYSEEEKNIIFKMEGKIDILGLENNSSIIIVEENNKLEAYIYVKDFNKREVLDAIKNLQ